MVYRNNYIELMFLYVLLAHPACILLLKQPLTISFKSDYLR